MKNYVWCLLLCLLAFTSCDSNRVYEKNIDIPENSWEIENVPAFEFQIQDTTKQYNIYFNIRNAIFYEYYNLYVRYNLIGPDGQQISSGLHEIYLMDKTTGRPLGSGAGDIFDHQVLALRNQTFEKTGTYKLQLKQYMRRDPLPGIMAVGIRVETIEEEK
ncbi:MAG: gliding motility lipoprotein GldH [Hymenobacteraceae bacterium]|nr:gliding motility lipoprotein GldH [Hymenobacteraceae bacterium]MDX5397065.1 gliding motility lipoprotein GldH [Hymenobacteraceae bacterium]MDX5442888.1 gliding motility lipoprotein GldH [Hymenobacteraceae bacterium]MDX5513135.1 gliding motility lipoprotein GldH [Hymenobacteraceae bacterium]